MIAQESTTETESSTEESVVDIPDANLKAVLNLQLDQPKDADITVAQAAAYTGQIYVNTTRTITDLTGLEAFTSAVGLAIRLEEYPSDSLDLTDMVGLTMLNLSGAGTLKSLDISTLTNLTYIYAVNMGLETISWPDPSIVDWFELGGNKLTATPPPSTNTGYRVLKIQGNSGITSVDFSDSNRLLHIDLSNTGITSVDVSASNIIQSVLVANLGISSIGLTEEAHNLYFTNFSGNTGLASFPGFSAEQKARLHTVKQKGNGLTSFDIAEFNNVSILDLRDNSLSGTFDICAKGKSGGPRFLYLADNEYTVLNSTMLDEPDQFGYQPTVTCGHLEEVDLDDNKFTDIDMSKQTRLRELTANGNCLADGGGLVLPPWEWWENEVKESIEYETLTCE